MRYVQDVTVRDKHPMVAVREPTAKALALGRTNPDSILFCITQSREGRSWWDLDDATKAILADAPPAYAAQLPGDWFLIREQDAPRLVAAFDAFGVLDRLVFMGLRTQ